MGIDEVLFPENHLLSHIIGKAAVHELDGRIYGLEKLG